MLQRILVPVDLTEKSVTAVDMAYELAAQSGAEVVLLYVIQTIEHVEFGFEELKPVYDRLESSTRKGLQEFYERFVANKLRIDQAIVYGQRTKEIIDFRYPEPHGSHRDGIAPHRPRPSGSRLVEY